MQIAFPGKNVVVCGDSRGIGRAIAHGFAKAGANVSIAARGAETLKKTEGELKAVGKKTHSGVCDLSDAAAIKRYIADAASALGGIDILVNNASGFGMSDDEAGWGAGINVDIMATVRASNEAMPLLAKHGGSIINITSISGYAASTRSAPYAAVKAAVINYTMSQALMHAGKKIRVNAIAPGSIEFPGGTWEDRKTSNPTLYNAILKSIPFGRLGQPDEIANVALFLASDHARWITGQTITVDGGQMLG